MKVVRLPPAVAEGAYFERPLHKKAARKGYSTSNFRRRVLDAPQPAPPVLGAEPGQRHRVYK